jgi:ATP-dependent RNA helicase DeaD
VRVYISVGESAGARPGDLVGAITGEAKITGADIGAVQIEDRYSLVEVREDRADQVLEALRGATIRGRAVTVSRYTDKAARKRRPRPAVAPEGKPARVRPPASPTRRRPSDDRPRSRRP